MFIELQARLNVQDELPEPDARGSRTHYGQNGGSGQVHTVSSASLYVHTAQGRKDACKESPEAAESDASQWQHSITDHRILNMAIKLTAPGSPNSRRCVVTRPLTQKMRRTASRFLESNPHLRSLATRSLGNNCRPRFATGVWDVWEAILPPASARRWPINGNAHDH